MGSVPTHGNCTGRDQTNPFQGRHNLSEFGLNEDEEFRSPCMFRNLSYENAAKSVPSVQAPVRLPARPPPTNWQDLDMEDEENLSSLMPPDELYYDDLGDEDSAQCSIRNAFGASITDDLETMRKSLQQQPPPSNLCLGRGKNEIEEGSGFGRCKTAQEQEAMLDFYEDKRRQDIAAQRANQVDQVQHPLENADKRNKTVEERPDYVCMSEVQKLIAKRREEMGLKPKCAVMKKPACIEALKPPKRIKQSKSCKQRSQEASPAKPLPRYAQPTKASQARALAEKQSQAEATRKAARDVELGIRYSSHVRGTGLKGKKIVCRENKKGKRKKESCPTPQQAVCLPRTQSPHTPARSTCPRTPPSCGQYLPSPPVTDNFEKEYEIDLRFRTPPRKQITEDDILAQIPKACKPASPDAPVFSQMQQRYATHKERRAKCKRLMEEDKQKAFNEMLKKGAIDVDINMALMGLEQASPPCYPEHEHLDSREMNYFELNDMLLADASAPALPKDLPEEDLDNISLQLNSSDIGDSCDDQEEFEILEQAMQAAEARSPQAMACTPTSRHGNKRRLRRELQRAPKSKRQFNRNLLPDLDIVEMRQQQFERDLNEDAPEVHDKTPPGKIACATNYVKDRLDQLTRSFMGQKNFPNVERMQRMPESIPSPPGMVYEENEEVCQTPPRKPAQPYDYVQSRMKHLEKKLLGQRNLPNQEQMAKMPASIASPPGIVYEDGNKCNERVVAAPRPLEKCPKLRTAAQASQPPKTQTSLRTDACEPMQEAYRKISSYRNPIPEIVINSPNAPAPCISKDAGTMAFEKLKAKLDAKKRAEEELQWEKRYIDAVNLEIDEKLKCMQSPEKDDDDLGILRPEEMDYRELGNAIGLDVNSPDPEQLPQENLDDVTCTLTDPSSDNDTGNEFEDLERIYDPETHLRSEAAKVAARFANCTPGRIAERQQRFAKDLEMAGRPDQSTNDYVQQRVSMLSRRLMKQRNFPIHKKMANFPQSIPSPPGSICEEVSSPFVKTPPHSQKSCIPTKKRSRSILGSKRPPPRTCSMRATTEQNLQKMKQKADPKRSKRQRSSHSVEKDAPGGLKVKISLSKTEARPETKSSKSPTKSCSRKRAKSAPGKTRSPESQQTSHLENIEISITPSKGKLPTIAESDRENTTPRKRRARATKSYLSFKQKLNEQQMCEHDPRAEKNLQHLRELPVGVCEFRSKYDEDKRIQRVRQRRNKMKQQMALHHHIEMEAGKLACALKNINDITNEILDPEDIDNNDLFAEGNYQAPPDDWRIPRPSQRNCQQEANNIHDTSNEILDPEVIDGNNLFTEGNYQAPPDDWRIPRPTRNWQQEANAYANRIYQRAQASAACELDLECEPTYEELPPSPLGPKQVKLEDYERDMRVCIPKRRYVTEAEVAEQIPKEWKPLSGAQTSDFPNIKQKFTACKERKAKCMRQREEQNQKAYREMLEKGAIDVDINMALMELNDASASSSAEDELLDSKEMDYGELNDMLLAECPAPKTPKDLPEEDLDNISMLFEQSRTEECDSGDELNEFEVLERAMDAVETPLCTPKRRIWNKRGLRGELQRAPRRKLEFTKSKLPDLDIVEMRQQQFTRDLNEDAPTQTAQTPINKNACGNNYVEQRIGQLTRSFMGQRNFPNVERMRRMPEYIPSPPGMIYEDQEYECKTPPRDVAPAYDYLGGRMRHLEKKLLGQRNEPNLERMARMPTSIPTPPGIVCQKQDDYVQNRIKHLQNQLLGECDSDDIYEEANKYAEAPDEVPSPFVKTPPRPRVCKPIKGLPVSSSESAIPCFAGKRAKARNAAQAIPIHRSLSAQAATSENMVKSAAKTLTKSARCGIPKASNTATSNRFYKNQAANATDCFMRASSAHLERIRKSQKPEGLKWNRSLVQRLDRGKNRCRIPKNTYKNIPRCNVISATPERNRKGKCPLEQSRYHLQVPLEQYHNDPGTDINNNEMEQTKVDQRREDSEDYLNDNEMYIDDVFGEHAIQDGYSPEDREYFKYAVARDKMFGIGEDAQHEDLEAIDIEFAPDCTPPHIVQENEDRAALTLRLPRPLDTTNVTVDSMDDMPQCKDTPGYRQLKDKLRRKAENAEFRKREAQRQRDKREEAKRDAYLRRMHMEAADAHLRLQNCSDSSESIIDLSNASINIGDVAEPVEPGLDDLPNYTPFDKQCR